MPPFYKETEAQKQGWNVNQATGLKSSRGGLKLGACGPAVPALLQGQAQGWASGSYHWRREAVVRGEAGSLGKLSARVRSSSGLRGREGAPLPCPGGGGESWKEWLLHPGGHSWVAGGSHQDPGPDATELPTGSGRSDRMPQCNLCGR